MAKAIYVKTSDTCNLHCDHCMTNGHNGGKVKWDVDATQRWVNDFMRQYSADEWYTLILHGGEPFLAAMDDIERFCEPYWDMPNVGLTVSTNLVYKLDARKLQFMKRLGSIGTSWDVDTRFATEYQKRRFEGNLEILQKENIGYCIFVTINQALLNLGVDAFFDEMCRLKPDRIRLERLTLDGNATRNPAIFPDNEAQDRWFVEVYKKYQSQAWPFKIVTLDIIKDKVTAQIVKTDTNCRDCEQNLVTMNADGTLGGCPNSAASRQHAHITEGVETFLNSDGRMADIVHELDFNPNCLQCDVFSLCGGDCHKLPWQGDRCGGLKHLLRYVKHGRTVDIIPLTAVK